MGENFLITWEVKTSPSCSTYTHEHNDCLKLQFYNFSNSSRVQTETQALTWAFKEAFSSVDVKFSIDYVLKQTNGQPNTKDQQTGSLLSLTQQIVYLYYPSTEIIKFTDYKNKIPITAATKEKNWSPMNKPEIKTKHNIKSVKTNFYRNGYKS